MLSSLTKLSVYVFHSFCGLYLEAVFGYSFPFISLIREIAYPPFLKSAPSFFIVLILLEIFILVF